MSSNTQPVTPLSPPRKEDPSEHPKQSPAKPPQKQMSQTEEDKQRADWEGMTPNKPTSTDD